MLFVNIVLQIVSMTLCVSGFIQLIVSSKNEKHTRAYLSLEKLRFGDDICIEEQLSCTSFELPALTLQPIARPISPLPVVASRSRKPAPHSAAKSNIEMMSTNSFLIENVSVLF